METGIPLCSRPGSKLGYRGLGLMQGPGLVSTDMAPPPRPGSRSCLTQADSSLWERWPQPLQPPFPAAILGLCLPLGGGEGWK